MFLKLLIINLFTITLTYNSNSTINLFIDTYNINNKYGIQNIKYEINRK